MRSVWQTCLAQRFKMASDIAIVSAHSGEPFLVLKGECRLDSEGGIDLAPSRVDLVKLRKVCGQMYPRRAQIWRTEHGRAKARQRV